MKIGDRVITPYGSGKIVDSEGTVGTKTFLWKVLVDKVEDKIVERIQKGQGYLCFDPHEIKKEELVNEPKTN